MGGVAKYLCEPVDTTPHALDAFDKEVDALRQLLAAKGLITVDELRRGIEAIPEETYHALSYYRKWMRSITENLIRKGVLQEDEVRAQLEAP